MPSAKKSCLQVLVWAAVWLVVSIDLAPIALAVDDVHVVPGQTADPAPIPNNPNAVGNFVLLQAIEAVTGDRTDDTITKILTGVVRIERNDDGIKLTKETDTPIVIGHDTTFGDTLLNGIDKATTKARAKFGDPAADFVKGIHAVSVDGTKVKVEKDGPTTIDITVLQKQEKHYWVKAVKIDDVSFDVAREPQTCAITNITGVSVILDAVNLPIEIREFRRWRDSSGQNVYSVGIKNPIPHPIVALFRLDEVLHLKFTDHGGNARPIDTTGIEEFNNSAQTTQPPGLSDLMLNSQQPTADQPTDSHVPTPDRPAAPPAEPSPSADQPAVQPPAVQP